MDNTQPIFLCASGNSVPFLNSRYNHNGFKNGLEPQLEEIIKGNYSIGINYFFKYGCKTTFDLFNDWQFYLDNSKALKNLPLIVGSFDPSLKNRNINRTHKNTILLNVSNKDYYGLEAWGNTFYCKQLVGIFALNLAICLGFTEIYLLGYDACTINNQTHFYEGVADLTKGTPIYIRGVLKDTRMHYRGVGKYENGNYKTSTYNNEGNHLNKTWFAPFKNLKNINVYNVSPESVITVFKKISYDDFYAQVPNNHIMQDQARANIKRIILDNKKE